LNEYFDVDQSMTHYFYNCKTDGGCTCVDQNRCEFRQQYGEGSSYNGFLVKDEMYFGENYHLNEDSVSFTFGCVEKETHLFYT
jgi:hypothetical protein